MKLLNTIGWTALAALVLIGSASAQSGYTSVTATVTDVSGNPYAGGRYQITFVYQGATGNKPLLSGSVFQQQVSGSLDSSGRLAVSLADNNAVTPGPSQWNFQICAASGAPCFSALLTITGSSQDISSALTAVAPPLHAFSGGTVFGGITATGSIQAQSIEQVRYADQFPGADIGAKINAAIANFGTNGCGTVMIAAGSYSFSTTILKPSCILIRGQGITATHLTYTGSGEAFIVGNGTSGMHDGFLADEGGLYDFWLTGPGIASSTIGVFVGGDPAGVIDASATYAYFQQFDLRVTGFGAGYRIGSNAVILTWRYGMIDGNGTGWLFPSSSTNFENFTFDGPLQFNSNNINVEVDGSFPDIRFFGTSLDFSGPSGTAPEIKITGGDPIIELHGCHLEQNSGALIAATGGAPQVLIFGGSFSLDASTGSDTSFISWTGLNGSTLLADGAKFTSGHTVSEIVNWSDSNVAASLSLLDLQSNGGSQFFAPTQAALPHWLNEHLVGIPGNGYDFLGLNGGQIVTSEGGTVFGTAFNSLDAPAQAGSCWHSAGTPDFIGGYNGKVCVARDGASGYDSELNFYTETKSAGNTTDTSAVEMTLHHDGSLAWGGGSAIPSSSAIALANQLPLTATTASIGGSALAAGTCTTGTVAVTNSTTAMAVAVSPAADPGTGFTWEGWVSAAGTVTVRLCNITAGSLTPTAEAYNVRVIQ